MIQVIRLSIEIRISSDRNTGKHATTDGSGGIVSARLNHEQMERLDDAARQLGATRSRLIYAIIDAVIDTIAQGEIEYG